jgi:hypothetical protein
LNAQNGSKKYSKTVAKQDQNGSRVRKTAAKQDQNGSKEQRAKSEKKKG